MKFYGLIGYPLIHSFSKQYFDSKFYKENISGCNYDLIPLSDISLFPEIIGTEKYSGFNVTVPYKNAIIKYLDSLDKITCEINAVNTVKVEKNMLKGYNTDVYGFENSLIKVIKNYHNKALILGTGGSSRSVEYVLKKLKIPVLFVSRKPFGINQISYSELNRKILNSYNLIINCTPVGMYPAENEYPMVPYKYLTPRHLLFDLIYNPEITMFLKFGKENGAKIQNGLQMLFSQAEQSWKIWNNDY